MSSTNERKGVVMAQRKNHGGASGVKREAHVRVKATEAEKGEGIVRGVASVWDNVDSYGDVMIKGAFADTIAEHAEAGDTVPFVWGHETQDPFAYLGDLVELRETDEGLEFEAHLDMDNPKAVQVYKLLKARRVRDLSFGFIPRDTSPSERDGEEVREVKSVELLEVSAVHVGANRAAHLLEVRAAKAEGDPEGGGEGDPVEDDPAEDDPAEGGEVTISAEDFEELLEVARAASTSAGTMVEKLEALKPSSAETDGKAAASGTPGRHEDRKGGKCSPTGGTAAAIDPSVLAKARETLALFEAERMLDNGTEA